jgi:epoxyqueuosine reductase
MPDPKDRISRFIKEKARSLGFEACGITEAGLLVNESPVFREWLKQEHHAGMAYLARNVDKRLDPTLLNEWARSVIMLTFNYYPQHTSLSEGTYKISKYAYGRDYHEVIKSKLRELVNAIEDEMGEILSRVFVDSAPVMEKAWAVKCGLGWIGKNACLINKKQGSFFFLGTIITNIELHYDREETNNYCGSCTRCLDACPNGALIAPGVLDSSRCISYLSIEHKGDFTEDQKDMLHGWIFGCDICQDVCPFNRFSKPNEEDEFRPVDELLNMTEQDWKNLNEEKFNELFKGTAVERTGYAGLRRNIEQGNRGTKEQRNGGSRSRRMEL